HRRKSAACKQALSEEHRSAFHQPGKPIPAGLHSLRRPAFVHCFWLRARRFPSAQEYPARPSKRSRRLTQSHQEQRYVYDSFGQNITQRSQRHTTASSCFGDLNILCALRVKNKLFTRRGSR